MKLNKINITSYKSLKDTSLDFENGINIITGDNSSGKTSIINFIKDVFTTQHFANNSIVLDDKLIEKPQDLKIETIDLNSQYIFTENKSSKLIHFPSDKSLTYNANTDISDLDKFVITPNSNMILGYIENYIKNYVTNSLLQNQENKTVQKVRNEIIKSLNDTFSTHLTSKLIGLDFSQNNKPIFQNEMNASVSIEHLSKGEHQLFAKAIFLKLLNPKDSIILIEEPEKHLHPKRQLDILDIYRNIGENNQFIFITHSPFLIFKATNDNVIFLELGKVKEIDKSQLSDLHSIIDLMIK